MTLRTYNQDAELILADGAAATTASGVGQVASADAKKQLGPGRFEGVLIVDVSAIKISANDESYQFLLEGASSSAFSAIEVLAELTLGATEVRPHGAIDSLVGRYEIPFITEQNSVTYDWVRLYCATNGTSESITFKAWIAEKPQN